MPDRDLTGRVYSDLLPRVPARIADERNGYSGDLEFVLDSGSNAHIVLPPSVKDRWQGEAWACPVYTVGSPPGKPSTLWQSRGRVTIGNSTFTCFVSFGGIYPCLGMPLLEGCHVQFEAVDGGSVTVSER